MSEHPTMNQFRDGMSLLAGAVTVLTTDGPAGKAGMTATAVCSVTDEPPTILACINSASYAHRLFLENGTLCANVLGADCVEISHLFSDRTVSMEERFDRVAHHSMATGAPILDCTLVALDGTITAQHEVGTHSVFLVRVEAIRIRPEESRAGLTYFNRDYHSVGL